MEYCLAILRRHPSWSIHVHPDPYGIIVEFRAKKGDQQLMVQHTFSDAELKSAVDESYLGHRLEEMEYRFERELEASPA